MGRRAGRIALNVAVPLLITLLGAAGLVEWGFRHFYQLIPLEVCASDPIVGNYYCQPYLEYDKPIRLAYHYRPGFHVEGWWDPADPNCANAAAETAPRDRSDAFWYVLEIDEMGFPNHEPEWRDQYDVVITGDSFTIRTDPVSWIDSLAEQTGYSILTLGAPSWSTLNEAEAIKLYGLDKRPALVLLMFFEGNDLFNTAQYMERQPTGLSWKEFDLQQVRWGRRLLTPHLVSYWLERLDPDAQPAEKHIRYPVVAATEAGEVEMVLKDIHLLPLSAGYDTLARSDEFARTRHTLIELDQLCRAQGTRLLVVYIPSKEHVYWLRIWDPVDVNSILERTVTVTLTGGDHGLLQWNPGYLSYQTFTENFNAQERLLADTAEADGIEFLNLTRPFMQQAIERGELYNYADPHWNQAGNQLAADLIAGYLASQ